LNENRKVFYQNAKKWVQLFNLTNDSLKASNKPLFTPTTVMEIGNNKYVFVLNKAKLNGKGHVVFKVSTKEIKSSDKQMLKLPCGHHDGVRFDIDRTLTLWASELIVNAGGCKDPCSTCGPSCDPGNIIVVDVNYFLSKVDVNKSQLTSDNLALLRRATIINILGQPIGVTYNGESTDFLHFTPNNKLPTITVPPNQGENIFDSSGEIGGAIIRGNYSIKKNYFNVWIPF
jgi:hypothetical protein